MERLPEDEIARARAMDPTAYLEGRGYTVRREGRHLSVRLEGDERYRITRKDDGHWVACDKLSKGIGDNIALVRREEPGTTFRDAVAKLAGQPARSKDAPERRRGPALPPEADPDRQAGRAYLQGRGIGLETIQWAERARFVRYTGGGVLFVGYDAYGKARNATRRATDRADPVQKRDLRGSDKRYPPVLPGSPVSVWIVEGGTDALALHEMARRSGERPPTVLVSGGANVRVFLETPEVQELLRRADRVTIAREREADPAKQVQTDAAHDQQRDRVREITGREVRDWRPPEGSKDLAAHNLRQMLQGRETRGDMSRGR